MHAKIADEALLPAKPTPSRRMQFRQNEVRRLPSYASVLPACAVIVIAENRNAWKRGTTNFGGGSISWQP